MLAGRTRLALATALVAVGLSACGGSDDARLLPADDAAGLLELLNQAEQTFEDESCDELDSTLTALDRAADGLPDAEVDRRLRTTLNAEIQDLTEMAERCEPPVEVEEPAPVPAPVPAPPPTTVPETTPPAPVEPTTEETETEEEPPPEDEEPKEKAPKPPPEQKPPEPPQRDPCANNSPRC